MCNKLELTCAPFFETVVLHIAISIAMRPEGHGPMDGSPELLFFVQTLLARCLMEPWCPHWGPQHFEAFGVPHIGAQLFHPLWDFCCRFQVRVLPMCNRIPALWNNLSANKSYILRHLSVWTVLTHRPRRRTTPRKEFSRALCTAKLKRISSAGPLVRLLLPDLAMPPLIVHPMVPSTLNARKATGVAMIPLPTISPRKHCGTRGPKPLSCRLTKLSIEGPNLSWRDRVADGICASPHRQSKLERGARLLDILHELARECSRNETAEQRSCGNPSNSTVRVGHCRHGCHREESRHFWRC